MTHSTDTKVSARVCACGIGFFSRHDGKCRQCEIAERDATIASQASQIERLMEAVVDYSDMLRCAWDAAYPSSLGRAKASAKYRNLLNLMQNLLVRYSTVEAEARAALQAGESDQ